MRAPEWARDGGRGARRDIVIVCDDVDGPGGVQRWAHGLAGLLSGRGHRVTLVGVTRSAEAAPHEAREAARARPYAVETLHESWPLPALERRPRTLRNRLDLRARLLDRRRAATRRDGAVRLAALLDGARPGAVVIVAQVWAMEWVRLAGLGGRAGLRVLALPAENAGHTPHTLLAVPGRAAVPREPVIACLGRLSHEKGADLAIEAWASMAARHPRWRLRLYGAGPREGALREQAERLGAAGAVEFAGVARDVPDALARASIFALPSRREGFPTALLEAMAAGLPAVAFDGAPGVRDLVTDGADGLLARPGDTAGFAAALDRLIMDPELRERLGGAAPRAARRFEAGAALDRWERMFDVLHREPSSARTTAPAAPRVPAASVARALRRGGVGPRSPKPIGPVPGD
ncbi:glycosyltransferase [Actinomadura rugatobispora]|uniref:Glycosyltransferase n=1 Tax=Actinomadura rugatobispora TaxID=1994 RepID=A0ABW0ZLU3_9ACTN